MNILYMRVGLSGCVLFLTNAFAQSSSTESYPHLCKENERVAFTCMANGKNISLCVMDWPQIPSYERQCSTEMYGGPNRPHPPPDCQWNFKDWNKGRMTYRFGSPEKFYIDESIELEYPKHPVPLKKAFRITQLASEDVSKEKSLKFELNSPNRKESLENFRAKHGIDLLPGVYTEIWFSIGTYTYTLFFQSVSNAFGKAPSGAGVVVEHNNKRLNSFICDDPAWAIHGGFYHLDGFNRSFGSFLGDINYLFYGRDNFKHESNGFRGVSPLNDVQRHPENSY